MEEQSQAIRFSLSAASDLAEGVRLLDVRDLAPGAHRVHVTLRLASVEVARGQHDVGDRSEIAHQTIVDGTGDTALADGEGGPVCR